MASASPTMFASARAGIDYSVNAADPIVAGQQIFVSSGYDHGCALLELRTGAPTRVWESKVMRNQQNASVLLDGHLYGMDGDNDSRGSTLHCVELATGKLKWAEASIRPGALMAADGRLIIMNGNGELVVAKASPERFQPLARAQILGGKCWTVPVLSHGRIYLRDARGDVVCVDVSADGPGPQSRVGAGLGSASSPLGTGPLLR